MIHPESSCEIAHRPGDVIADKYRLQRVLGEGGQACVWLARNLVLELDVAIKFVAGSGGDGAQAARLLIEARAAAKLRHPGVVRVFDFGRTEEGDSFLVLEFLEGESLARSIVVNRRLAPERALALLLPIADALGAAHAAGIVHRDIKPANIFLATSDGHLQPKLLDFGIAKVESATALPSELTRAGSIVGSPAYLSPEQARGEGDPDHRVDIWAFTATLYQALTGQLPFPEDTYNALLWAIVQNEPRSIVELGIGDEALWSIIQRGLAKSRAERWGSVDEMGRELAAWLGARGVKEDVTGAPLTRWVGRRTNGASAGGDLVEADHPTVPSARNLDNTAQLHPPLARSVPTTALSRTRRQARIAAAAALAGCGLAVALYWLEQRSVITHAGVEPGPVAALSAPASLAVTRAAPVVEPVAKEAVDAPSVVPAETPIKVATALVKPSLGARAANANANANANAKTGALGALELPKPLPKPSALATNDPGAELLNPY